jgi:hypothetical protein
MYQLMQACVVHLKDSIVYVKEQWKSGKTDKAGEGEVGVDQ